VIILSMLGTGNNQLTRYTFGDKSCETTLFPLALKQWFPEASIYALVTAEAEAKHGEALLKAAPDSRLIGIQIGEPWSIYQAINNNITAKSQVILDITHGFRSLPMLAMLSIGFLREAKQVKLESLLYGAFEAAKDGQTPVFDLTPFVTMLDWANATNRFVETGDARKFETLVAGSVLRGIGKDLKDFSDALIFNRTEEANKTAKSLSKKLLSVRDSPRTPAQQPFSLLEDRIVRAIEPIAHENEIFSQFAQVSWYAEKKQFAQAIALAREWMVSVRIWKTDGHFSTAKLERELAEDWLHSFAKFVDPPQEKEKIKKNEEEKSKDRENREKRLLKVPVQWRSFVVLWDKLADKRNDYAHFGMRPSQSSSGNTRKKILELLQELRAAVAPLGLELPESSEPS
jgi:CRISPR-associated DxTHG motif protein